MTVLTVEAVIAARRNLIRDEARCEGCGSALASCEAQQGKDPTAPPWFGCCSTGNGPCHHAESTADLGLLLDEIAAGQVRTVDEVLAARPRPRVGMVWFTYLNQDTNWQPNGKPLIAVADMDREWRFNAARWLEKRAPLIALQYDLDEIAWWAALSASPTGPSETAADMVEADMEAEQQLRHGNPVAWIRTKALHRALVADLPTKKRERRALAEWAKHWAGCPVRDGRDDCRCDQLRAQHEHEEQIRVGCPEWTDD